MSKKNKNGPTIVGKKSESLPVKLTKDEVRERGKRLAQVEEEIRREDERATDVKAHLKAEMSRLESERQLLALIVRNEEEHRPVTVLIEGDYDKGVIREIREDTSTLVRTRAMEDYERQGIIPGAIDKDDIEKPEVEAP